MTTKGKQPGSCTGRTQGQGDTALNQELTSYRTVNLLATYEELCGAADDERLTCYFPNYGCHYLKPGMSEEQLRAAYGRALAAIEMDGPTFRQTEGFLYRGEIICRMRDCLLSQKLTPGQKILFAGTEPCEELENFALQTGTVQAVDRELKSCTVMTQSTTMEHVPLHYVLGLCDHGAVGLHYGFEHIRPLFDEDRGLAAHCLSEAREKWNAAEAHTQSMTQR